jgi:hypothetical protein
LSFEVTASSRSGSVVSQQNFLGFFIQCSMAVAKTAGQASPHAC